MSTSTVTSDMTVEAKAFVTVTVTLDEPLDIVRSIGYQGKTKTIRVSGVVIRWYVDLTSRTPRWHSSEKVQANNLLKDGAIGAPVNVYEHFWSLYGTTAPSPLQQFVHEAIESTRPATVPTFTLNPEA